MVCRWRPLLENGSARLRQQSKISHRSFDRNSAFGTTRASRGERAHGNLRSLSDAAKNMPCPTDGRIALTYSLTHASSSHALNREYVLCSCAHLCARAFVNAVAGSGGAHRRSLSPCAACDCTRLRPPHSCNLHCADLRAPIFVSRTEDAWRGREKESERAERRGVRSGERACTAVCVAYALIACFWCTCSALPYWQKLERGRRKRRKRRRRMRREVGQLPFRVAAVDGGRYCLGYVCVCVWVSFAA